MVKMCGTYMLVAFIFIIVVGCIMVNGYDVVELDSSHFELIQVEYEYIAVLFYDSSEKGQKMKQEWSEGINKIVPPLPEGCEIAMIFVSDGEFREYLDLHHITVPGALVLRKGEGSEFSCPIDRLTLANCIAEDIKPAVSLVSSLDDLESALKKTTGHGNIFGLFRNGDMETTEFNNSMYEDQAWESFVSVAETFRGYLTFYSVESSALLSVFGVAEYVHPIVLMILPDERIIVHEGEIKQSTLIDWIFQVATPGNHELGLNTTVGDLYSNHFFLSPKKKFILIAPPHVLTDGPILTHWRDLSQSYQNRAIFSYLSNPQFGGFAEYFNINSNELPIVVSQVSSHVKYKSSKLDLSNTESEMQLFVSEVLNGVARQYLRSAPHRAFQKGSIVELVADDLLNTISKTDRDVVLALYVPWCETCHQFLPMLELLGRAVQSEPRIFVARMDVRANDVPVEWKIKNTPSLLYFSAADNAHGDRIPFPRYYWNGDLGLFEIMSLVLRESSFVIQSLNVASSAQLSLIMEDEPKVVQEYLEEEHIFRRNEKRPIYEDFMIDWLVGEIVFDGRRWHIIVVTAGAISWLLMAWYIANVSKTPNKQKSQ